MIERVSVTDIMEKVRREAASQLPQTGSDPRGVATHWHDNWNSQGAPFPVKSSYDLEEFLSYQDEAFIENAYLGILKRQADMNGLGSYLHKLRTGELSKLNILALLRFSPEGRRQRVRVAKLAGHYLRYRLTRIPILGYSLRLAMSLFRLPRFASTLHALSETSMPRLLHQQELLLRHSRQVEQLEPRLHQVEQLEPRLHQVEQLEPRLHQVEQLEPRLYQVEQLEPRLHQVEQLEPRLDEQLTRSTYELRERMGELKCSLGRLIDLKAEKQPLQALEALVQELRIKLDQTAADLNQHVNQRLEELIIQTTQLVANGDSQVRQEIKSLHQQLLDYRRNLLDQQHRLSLLLEEVRKRLPAPLDIQQINAINGERDHLLDALYVSFEDRFRGTRQEIKERLQVYLPYLKIGANNSMNILDIGCGRGEWLELLKEQNQPARGVDINRVLVRECLGRELEVIEMNAIIYLREQADSTLDVITGFHIIEHLSLNDLIALLDESLRVLKPGGLIIFETPNPENLVVGAYTFYFDPTHRNPLPPALTEYLAEQRGFVQTQILRLHRRDEIGEPDAFKEHWFCRETDYALIAYKA